MGGRDSRRGPQVGPQNVQRPTVYNPEADGPDPGSQQSRTLEKDFSDPSASRSEIIPRFRLGLGAEANLQTLIAREGSGQEGREQRGTGQFSAVTTGLE